MQGLSRITYLKPWTLPLIVAAIIVPVVAAFVLGGALVGLALGALVGAALVLTAALQRPAGVIETARPEDARRHVLVVLSHELDDPSGIERVKRESGLARPDRDVEVRVLAPAKTGLLDLWATDVRTARAEAQRKLVVSVASLAKADVSADAAVGDHDIVRAVEDELRSFPATEVVLVTGGPDEDRAGDRAASELSERLQQPLSRVVVDVGELYHPTLTDSKLR
jgi:hypothetical protein